MRGTVFPLAILLGGATLACIPIALLWFQTASIAV